MCSPSRTVGRMSASQWTSDAGARDLLQREFHNVFQRHVRRIDDDGIGRRLERTYLAAAVLFVTVGDIAAGGFGGLGRLRAAPFGSGVLAGMKVELQRCIRQDDGPNIAPREHGVALSRYRPLLA